MPFVGQLCMSDLLCGEVGVTSRLENANGGATWGTIMHINIMLQVDHKQYFMYTHPFLHITLSKKCGGSLADQLDSCCIATSLRA